VCVTILTWFTGFGSHPAHNPYLLPHRRRCAELVRTVAKQKRSKKDATLKRRKRGKVGHDLGPFQPVSKPSPVEGPLAKIQIDREMLVPSIPLGQGQFGEVIQAEHIVGLVANIHRAC
jgi:hypothetical protein